MRTTPRSYYELFVWPNYWEYMETPFDVRRAFNASISAFQMADIFYGFYKRHDREVVKLWPTKRDFLLHLGKTEPQFLTVQSVATAYKHLYPTGEHYVIGSPGSLVGLQAPNGVRLRVNSGGERADVIVRRRDKTRVSLKRALQKVVDEMWPAVLPKDPI
jgi:hypothetical protein